MGAAGTPVGIEGGTYSSVSLPPSAGGVIIFDFKVYTPPFILPKIFVPIPSAAKTEPEEKLTWAEAAGTATATGTKIVWTATGAVGPFRFVVLYNDTQTVPADPLVNWWDYASSISLASGETFSVKFNASETTGSIFTLA